MHTRTLGKTNLKVSVLGFGGAPAAFLPTEELQIVAMLNQMLDAGVNVLDTASLYAGSEAFIGKHLSNRRKDYVLVSKCGPKMADLPGAAWSRELILASIDRSLRLLRTDVIDVMLLHTCDLETLKKGDALDELVKARAAGKVRHCGHSGDNDAAVYAAGLADVAVIETSINIVEQANAEKVMPAARQHNVGVIAKRPVANAAWKDLQSQPGFYKNYAKEYTQRLAQMNIAPSTLGFNGPPETAWPEVAIRFTLTYPEVSIAVVGTTNPAHARANIEFAKKGPLDLPAFEALRAAYKAVPGSENWPGLT